MNKEKYATTINKAIDYIKNNTFQLCIWIICILMIGFIISKLLKYESYISGSGIPQVEAEMIDQIDEKWYKVILAKMIAGTLSIVGGLSLGREGPSLQLGAMIGKGLASVFKRMKLEEIRKDIDKVDSQIADLFKERMALSLDIAKAKQEGILPVVNASR